MRNYVSLTFYAILRVTNTPSYIIIGTEVYVMIQITNNLVNIQQVKGEDLEIVDTDKYDYIMTYSFP